MRKLILYALILLMIVLVIIVVGGFWFVKNFSKTYPPLKTYSYLENIDSIRTCIANANFYNHDLTVTYEDSLISQNRINYFFDVNLNNNHLSYIYQLSFSKNKEDQIVILKIANVVDNAIKESYDPKKEKLNQDMIITFEKNILDKLPCLRAGSEVDLQQNSGQKS